MKQIEEILTNQQGHWVGNGFPVRTLFHYGEGALERSPFLLFDFAGPYDFPPADTPRGVGEHPHRGFETVSIVYEGEVSHKDSSGAGGSIGPGDVQWMTAGGGILHEEFHSREYTEKGGRFLMVQLWVNLPTRDKMVPPHYQGITAADIANVDLPDHAGTLRVIAGDHDGHKGPAHTHTPMNLWDVKLKSGHAAELDLPEGHTAMIAVLQGQVKVNDQPISEAQIVRFAREGTRVRLQAETDTLMLVMTGEPLHEPVVGKGPFVMNTDAEIAQAFTDFRNGVLHREAV